MYIRAVILNCVHQILKCLKGALVSSKEATGSEVCLDLFTILYLLSINTGSKIMHKGCSGRPASVHQDPNCFLLWAQGPFEATCDHMTCFGL